MNLENIESQLEQIGLNESEIKVYLSLLKLGASSTGPIIKESKTANSKIYEVLDKLIDKGLVSYFIKQGVKYYRASSPIMLLEFLKKEKKKIETQEKNIKKVLPTLLQFQQKKEKEKETYIYSGSKGIRTAFRELVNELNKGEEVHIMGVHDFGEEFLSLALYFQKIRSEKGIKAKFLINKNAKDIAKKFKEYPPLEIKFMPEDILTPGIFLIYKDKVIINLPKEKTFFVIKSKSANETFKQYFELLWKQAKK